MSLIDKLFFAFLKWSFICFLIAVVLPIVIHYYIYKFEYNVKKEKIKETIHIIKKAKKLLDLLVSTQLNKYLRSFHKLTFILFT